MTSFIKAYWQYIILLLLASTAISYGVSDFIDFFKALCLLFPLTAIGMYYLFGKTTKELETEQIVQSLDQIIGEQAQVIEDYEQIFESQLVELPCVCGGNTFQGLFSPKLENVVECEKCKNKYRVSVNYDSVLISEPMDIEQTFQDLIPKNH
jgi:hypothetical protein